MENMLYYSTKSQDIIEGKVFSRNDLSMSGKISSVPHFTLCNKINAKRSKTQVWGKLKLSSRKYRKLSLQKKVEKILQLKNVDMLLNEHQN